MSHTVEYLTPERLPAVWPSIKPFVDRCVVDAAHGEYDADTVYRYLNGGKAFAFIEALDGSPTFVVVFEVVWYDKFRAANVLCLGGSDFKGARDRIWPRITDWLKANNISSVDASVSDGMYRMCKRLFGFGKVYNHIRLNLGERQ